ncbi:thioredoxin family protein [Pseudaquabacterium pictum]|uniref:Lipoprotein n=1 Tax=Pseudaquabacterium pictum TaxID=2315236 RepID=A0A480ATT1_9BURK|nr:thioredoxin fold domain-containing protein [Rubrivivax pictus]GCL64821.1 lipoprotein [Rubrivivax pictus]
MRHPVRPARLPRAARAWLLAGALCLGAPWVQAAAPGPGVAWVSAAADADIERAFAQAKAEKKPLLLYWGATWCPPCNQLKATLFNRADFIDRAKSFVAVHIDGDRPGAQQLGARFKVRGYPTMILMAADGSEITRLPGEVDAPQVLSVLQLGLAGGRPVKAVLADARAGKPVSGPEWRMLAFYGWDTDEAQLVTAAERPALLAQLSRACPPAERQAATRLLLKALAESDDGKGIKPDAALRDRVRQLLADAAASRAQMDVVVNFAPDITKALAPEPGADRQALVTAFDAALQRLEVDASLSRADRLGALISRVALARIDLPPKTVQPKLPEALVQRVRAHVARDDQQITDGHERQAVITSGAYALGEAGLWAESEALLKANLAKSHSPYYLMSQLGSNARKQGQNDEALRWYAQAWEKSEGPATRLQWGASYFGALVDLAPQDAARIEQVARALFTEAAKDRAAFHERSARSLQRVGSKLEAWNQGPQQAAVLQRLHDGPQGLAAVCGKLEAADPQRVTCEGIAKGLLKKPSAPA